MKGKCIAVVALLAGIVCLSSALGETLSVAPSHIAMITGEVGGQNVARVVFNADVPEQVLNGKADFAELRFPTFTVDSGDAAVTVVARDCKTAWDEEATWVRRGIGPAATSTR